MKATAAPERRLGAGLLLLLGYVGLRLALEARYRLFDPDEALEMLAAGSLRDGKLPYLGALSHRGPFLTLLYGIPVTLFGPDAYRAVHAFCILLFVALGIWFQRSVARATSERVALLALANLLLLGVLRIPTEDNWGLNSDFLMGGLATGAMCLLLARRAYEGAGLVLALAFLTKQNAAPYVAVPLAYVVFFDRDRAAAKLWWLTKGFITPLALALAVYATVEEVPRAWYFFYEYNRDYASAGFTQPATVTALALASWFGRSYGELLALAALAAVILSFTRRKDSRHGAAWRLAVLWTLAGFAAAVLPGKNWDNYLWAAHAPVALLGALGADALVGFVERRVASPVARWASACAVLAVPLLGCVSQWDRGRAVLAAATEVGGIPPPRVPRRELLDRIARATREDDAIYVTGYAPEMYVLAARRPASRHVISNFVESVYPGRFESPSHIVPQFFTELKDDLDRSRPRVVLDACALGFLCHPSSALTKALPSLLRDYHALPGAPPGVFLRNE